MGQGAGATRLPGFRVELMSKSIDPTFYFFEARWANPKPASVIVGHYAVDPNTGDVWDGVVCSEFTSPLLRRLQVSIRRRLGITDDKYRVLRRKGPMCD